MTCQCCHTKSPNVACGGNGELVLMQVFGGHPIQSASWALFDSQAKRCSCKMGETKVGKKGISVIGYQYVRLLRGFVRSTIWLRNKYTYAFDISVYNRPLLKSVEIMQSVCDS